jgi:prepilin-type N-terminal cleavage/methylation domain-containing protein
MKKTLARPRSCKSSGFTLVELLVVIGIIAILAGVILSAGNSALRAAQRARAANMANQIQTSVLNYFSEYSVYPVSSGATSQTAFISDSDATGSATSWGSLLYCLSGNIHPSTGLATPAPSTAISNTRGIAFLSFKASDVDSNDAPLNPLSPDPANPYFNIAMDADYAGVLGVAPSTFQAMPNFGAATKTSLPLTGGSSTAGVAVWVNCTGKPAATACNPAWWEHTY